MSNKLYIYIQNTDNQIIIETARSFSEIIKTVTGKTYIVEKTESFSLDYNGLVFSDFNSLKELAVEFEKQSAACFGDGFCVTKINNTIFVLSHTDRGVYYGAHELIERNLPVVFSRGAKEEAIQFIKVDGCAWQNCNFIENTPFSVRSWNLCGVGTGGKGHIDDGTAECLAKNKANATFHSIDESWRKLGLFHNGKRINSVQCFDDVMDTHPEYFMTGADGKPKTAFGGYESFPNYYEKQTAEFLAKRLVDGMDGANPQDIFHWTMPDNSYFYVVKDGVKLHDKPFVCDDGVMVYPTDSNYKSTVYFNFLNRLIREANKLRPNTYLSVFAYIYTEAAPATEIDEHLIITVAPINTNEKYSYIDKNTKSNDKIRENILEWTKKTDKIYIYTYWQSFKGASYTRPILKTVKENLLWFKQIGVRGIIVESAIDCTYSAVLNNSQKNSRLFYDMNEAYIWAIQKLMWNPTLDIDALLNRYTEIVYKESAKEMQEYFNLLQIGWDKNDASVWYTTGGDIYYLQFIIGAGVSEKIIDTLECAYEKAVTLSVKRKLTAIRGVVLSEIKKYKDFVKEEAHAVRFWGTVQDLLSESSLDYVNNKGSFWNNAIPLKVLRYPSNMKYYPESTEFSCRILYDDKNLYFGYTVFDQNLSEIKVVDGKERYFRSDGSEVIGVSETYIGGDILNQSVYYGYISGFMDVTRNSQGEFYKNDGAIKGVPLPDGVQTVRFAKATGDKRYHFHVQVIPLSVFGESVETVKPYGSFTFVSDKFGCAGWMGYGLWSKQNFQRFYLENDTGGNI